MRRLRLAWLTGTWPASSETFLAREVEGLRRLGHDVRVIAFQPGPPGPDPAALYRTSRLPEHPGVARCLAAIARQGLTEPRLAARWLRNLPFAAWLAHWCADEAIDWLHAAWSGLPAQVAWFARQMGGRPYSVAAHAHDVFCAPESSEAALLDAAGVTVCNRAARDALLRRLPGLADRLVLQPHGLPLEAWNRREREPAGEAVVLAVGRLVVKKGFDTAILALRDLPGVRFEVIGDGPESGALRELAAFWGVSATWRGEVSQAEVREAMDRATALVLPSRVDPAGDRDGLANVLLEAAAAGLPVVTTPAGSATDLVIDGQTGLLVPADEPAALAAALRRVLDDAGLRQRLTDQARAAVERSWDAARNHARLADWLRLLADKER